jgi:hypothetical protein
VIKDLPEFLKISILKCLPDPRYIYELLDPRTNEVRYVGKTKNLKKRYNAHLSNLGSMTKKTSWIKSLKAKNLKPIMRVIAVTTEKHINNSEISYIKNSSNLTNGTCGGDGQSNMSAETRAKIRLTKFMQGKRRFESTPRKLKAVVGIHVVTGEVITFPCAASAAEFIFGSKFHIGSCSRKYKGFRTHKQYIWRYLEN